MIKTYIAMPLGALALSLFMAPGAFAGCGNTASRLSVFMPEARPATGLSGAGLHAEAKADGSGPSNGPLSVVGLWSSDILVDGQVIYQAFESFTSDGLEFLNDNGSPIVGNVCFGTWAYSPKNMITIYHPSWNYDQNGNLIGTVIIRTQITVAPGGNSFTGTVLVDFYDLNGQPAGPELQAQTTGKKISASGD